MCILSFSEAAGESFNTKKSYVFVNEIGHNLEEKRALSQRVCSAEQNCLEDLRHIIKEVAEPEDYMQANRECLVSYITDLINKKIYNNPIKKEFLTKFIQKGQREVSMAVRI